jgi:hypothetical protein
MFLKFFGLIQVSSISVAISDCSGRNMQLVVLETLDENTCLERVLLERGLFFVF